MAWSSWSSKTLREITGVEEAQLLSYLKASGKPTELLLNFGTPRLTYRRFIWTSTQERPG